MKVLDDSWDRETRNKESNMNATLFNSSWMAKLAEHRMIYEDLPWGRTIF